MHEPDQKFILKLISGKPHLSRQLTSMFSVTKATYNLYNLTISDISSLQSLVQFYQLIKAGVTPVSEMQHYKHAVTIFCESKIGMFDKYPLMGISFTLAPPLLPLNS
jgi:hypothetical protein